MEWSGIPSIYFISDVIGVDQNPKPHCFANSMHLVAMGRTPAASPWVLAKSQHRSCWFQVIFSISASKILQNLVQMWQHIEDGVYW